MKTLDNLKAFSLKKKQMKQVGGGRDVYKRQLLHNVKIGLKKISDNKIKCYLCCYTSRKNKMNRKMNRAFYCLLYTSLYSV